MVENSTGPSTPVQDVVMRLREYEVILAECLLRDNWTLIVGYGAYQCRALKRSCDSDDYNGLKSTTVSADTVITLQQKGAIEAVEMFCDSTGGYTVYVFKSA